MSIWLQRGAIASITSLDERRLNVALGASSPVPISTTSLVASFSCSRISPGTATFTAPGEISASSSRLSVPTLSFAFSVPPGSRLVLGCRAEQEGPALLGAIERPANDAGRRFGHRQDRHRAASGLFPAVAGQRRERAGKAKRRREKKFVAEGLCFTRLKLSGNGSVEESAGV